MENKKEKGASLWKHPFLHAQGSNFSKAELNYKNILQPHTAILPTKKESLTLTRIKAIAMPFWSKARQKNLCIEKFTLYQIDKVVIDRWAEPVAARFEGAGGLLLWSGSRVG